MAGKAPAAAYADYSFPDDHCSSADNCRSSAVGLAVARRMRLVSRPPALTGSRWTPDRTGLERPSPSPPARLVTGIIGCIPVDAPACAAGSPTRWAVLNSLAAVLTARAALAVVVNRRPLMLLGLRGRQRGRRDLDEHAGVLGHQQTTTAW